MKSALSIILLLLLQSCSPETQIIKEKEYIYISEDAAEYLAEIGVKLVGIDYLSVEQYGAARPAAHIILLKAGVVLVEGLNLSEVQPGHYDLICLPLLIRGGDGSPCRAVLVDK